MAEAPETSSVMENATGNAKMDKNMLFAVLQFLRINNLKAAEEALRKEADVSAEEGADKGTQLPVEALVSYRSEGDPRLYEDHYTNLRSFVERSLDIHKCELTCILYPVFIHMYLQLIYNGHEERASQFFHRFSSEQEYYFQEDLQQLSLVKKREHMSGNQLLENFQTGKFVIRMSRDSYNHLKRYLLENKLNVLLTIIQQHLFIDVFDGLPRNVKQIEAASGGMLGEAKKEANKQKIYFGLLKEPDIVLPPDEQDEEDGDKPKRKKQKKEAAATKKGKVDPNAPAVNRIPMPEWKESDKMEKVKAVKESRKRTDLGPENIPSICFYTFLNASESVTAIDMSSDISLITSGYATSDVRVHSLTGDKLRRMKTPTELELVDKDTDDVLERIWDDKTSSEHKTLYGHCGPVYSTHFNHDRTLLVSGSEDTTVRLWSLHTWSNLVVYKGHMYPVWDCKFGPYSHYFVSGGADRLARLWSVSYPQPLRLFAGHLSDIDSVDFHPNSNYVVTGSSDRTVRLWDVLSGNCVRILTGHKGPVQKLTFSPDGKYLASAGADGTILLWDIAQGEMVGHLQGHKSTVHSLAFSRDSTLLASGGLDRCVKLWNFTKLLDSQEADDVAGFSNPLDYLIASFPTKNTSVLHLNFSRRNLLMACGPFDQ